MEFLSKSKIPTSNMCGQGYDRASNMSSDSVGVQEAGSSFSSLQWQQKLQITLGT